MAASPEEINLSAKGTRFSNTKWLVFKFMLAKFAIQYFQVSGFCLCEGYIRRWTRSPLVRIMACSLNGAKLGPWPVLIDHQLNPLEWYAKQFLWKWFYKKNALEVIFTWSSRRVGFTHWVRDKMVNIFQTTILKWFFCHKIDAFWLNFHWNMTSMTS